MRRWPFTFRRTDTPLATLLRTLDSLAESGAPEGGQAAQIAARIRRDKSYVNVWLSNAARHALVAKAWVASTGVIAAAAAYDKATTGYDWERLPDAPIRARRLRSPAEVQAASERRLRAAQKRVTDQQAAQALAYLRDQSERN